MRRQQSNWERTLRRERLRDYFTGINFGKLRKSRDDDDLDVDVDDLGLGDDDIENIKDEDDDALPPALEQSIAAIMTAAPGVTREQAASWLIHTARGRATHAALSKQRKDTPPMTTRADEMREMRDFAKSAGGMQSIAKHVIEKGTTTLTEHEFTTLLQEHAKLHKAAGESDGAAFSRIFSAPESIDIRRAHAITKNTPAPMMSIDPVQVGGKDATDVNDARKAYDQLTALAEEQRRRSPGLSSAQAFARVFENPENVSLAARAHRRPSATTSYEFPR